MRLCSSATFLLGVSQYRVDTANAIHNLGYPQIDEETCERDGVGPTDLVDLLGDIKHILQRHEHGGMQILMKSSEL
jgi:hypothetical protein